MGCGTHGGSARVRQLLKRLGVGGLADHVGSPAFATAVGLVLYGQRNRAIEPVRTTGIGAFGRVAGRLKGLFREFF